MENEVQNKISPPKTDTHPLINEPLPSEKTERFMANPDFDGGTFVMILPNSSRGFTLQTDRNLPRFNDEHPYSLTDEQKKAVAADTPGQLKYTGGTAALEALKEYRQNPTEENKKKFEEAQKIYLSRNASKYGIRNIRRSGDTISFDTKPVAFSVNKVLGDISSSAETLEFAAATATCGSIITSDGRLLVVHRSPKNDPYGDMPGASVGGYFDAQINPKKSKGSPHQGRRTLMELTKDTVRHNGIKEMEEELGLDEKDVRSFAITGLALEKKNVHHEFLFDINLKLTAAQVKEKASREREIPEEEFAEKFVDIEATPESIFKLLTQVVCPLPPTHYASFAATGYRMVLEKKGQKEADIYKKTLEIGIKENVERIDRIVRDYFKNNPEALSAPTRRQMERFEPALQNYLQSNPNATDDEKEVFRQEFFAKLPKLDPNGYSRFFLPTDQGLPDFETAMKNAGLISSN